MLLYTDASVYQGHGVAAWAIVASQADKPLLQCAGLFGPDEVGQSGTAEILAVAYGLEAASEAGYLVRGDTVRTYCDNQAVVDRINAGGRAKEKAFMDTKRGRRGARYLAAHAHVRALAHKHDINLVASWIRGHGPDRPTCPHQPHHRWCDQAARSAVRNEVRDRRARTSTERGHNTIMADQLQLAGMGRAAQ